MILNAAALRPVIFQKHKQKKTKKKKTETNKFFPIRLTLFTCRPDSLLVGIFGFFESIGGYGDSKAVAVGVVVSAFLFTPFFNFAGCGGGMTGSNKIGRAHV